jgi:hypothetical protein
LSDPRKINWEKLDKLAQQADDMTAGQQFAAEVELDLLYRAQECAECGHNFVSHRALWCDGCHRECPAATL